MKLAGLSYCPANEHPASPKILHFPPAALAAAAAASAAEPPEAAAAAAAAAAADPGAAYHMTSVGAHTIVGCYIVEQEPQEAGMQHTYSSGTMQTRTMQCILSGREHREQTCRSCGCSGCCSTASVSCCGSSCSCCGIACCNPRRVRGVEPHGHRCAHCLDNKLTLWQCMR